MIWSVPPIWDGGEVWILGGGSSVPKQFGIPEEIIEKVVNGELPPSAYSPYMEAIHNKHVIGINVSFLIGTWMDMMFFADAKFFRPQAEALAKWPKLRVTCWPEGDGVPWLKFIPRYPGHFYGISDRPDRVCWNGNSGAAAISIAANAGAKRIILLGFDMFISAGGSRHWHNLYKKEIVPVPVQKRREAGLVPGKPFGKHLHGFPEIAEAAKARGIEIINASPESAIKQFPKCNVKDLL